MKLIKNLLCLGTLGLSVYCGIMFGIPYYKYYSFKTAAAEIVQFEVEKDEDIKNNLLKKAGELKVPVKEEDVIVSRKDGFKAKAKWSETVNILDQYKKTIDFAFEVPEGK